MTQAKIQTKSAVRSESQATNAENKARKARAEHYAKALKEYDKHCTDLFNYWKQLRDEEKDTRKKYAAWILSIAGFQSLIIYAWAIYSVVTIESTTTLEIFGLVTLVCTQSFGLVFVVVKYFFGQKPEGLSEITQFIDKTRPISPVPDKKSIKTNNVDDVGN